MIVIFNGIVDLLMPNSINILTNFSLSFNLRKILTCCKAIHTIFYCLLRIISSHWRITAAASSGFSNILALSSVFLFSCFLPLTIDLLKSFLISSMVFLIFFPSIYYPILNSGSQFKNLKLL